MTLINNLNYHPRELSFGTSGLRGLVRDMTDLECYINTTGFLNFIKKIDQVKTGTKILIAGDLRESTPRIMGAVYKAILDEGFTALNCGLVPTPTAALLAFNEKVPCIVVTGSHIPAARNGIKYYKKEGEVLKEDETLINSCVQYVRRRIYNQQFSDSIFDKSGSLKTVCKLPIESKSAEDVYKKRFTNFFDPKCLRGKKLVFYQQSAVGRDLLVQILRSLGAEVIPIKRSATFIPIDTENVTEKEKKLFKSFAQAYPDAFAILSTDGDSDRPFVIDENGVFHRGDILGAVVAKYLGATFAAYPISSNDAVDKFMNDSNITFSHTKIGSPYVIASMESNKKDKTTVGWEVNGGFLVGNHLYMNGKILSPLPTRDACLPILCTLLAAIKNNQKLSELFAELPSRCTSGGLVNDVPTKKIKSFNKICHDEIKISELMGKVFNDSNLGKITQIDLTNGLRLNLSSGNVVHLRPSGNAPQFRVYSNANTQKDADRIVSTAINKNGCISKLLDSL